MVSRGATEKSTRSQRTHEHVLTGRVALLALAAGITPAPASAGRAVALLGDRCAAALNDRSGSPGRGTATVRAGDPAKCAVSRSRGGSQRRSRGRRPAFMP